MVSWPRLLVCCLLMAGLGCQDSDVAGGYDDVENPALAIALKNPADNTSLAGSVAIYARYQNPTQDTLPLYAAPTDANGTLLVGDSALLGAMALAQARGVNWPHPDTLEFNVVGRSPQAEGFMSQIALVKQGPAYRFLRRDGTVVIPANAQGQLPVTLPMPAPVLNYAGSIGQPGLDLDLVSVFIPGSPYFARIQGDGHFLLARLAAGRYGLKAMAENGKVYGAANDLNTDTAYTAENWSEADIIWVEQ